MKKLHIFLILVITFTVFCVNQQKDRNRKYLVNAIRTEYSIKVDGYLDEPVWQKAEKIYLKDSDTGREVTNSTHSAFAHICYDDTMFYIAFSCHDKDIYSNFTERDQHLWEEEAVEVFIDVDEEPNTYVEIELSPNNVLFDSYIVDPIHIDVEGTSDFNLTGLRTGVFVEGTVNKRNDEDQKWTAEIAVSFTDIVKDFKPEILNDAEWKINFYRIDRDNDGPVHYAWSPTMGRFHKPSVFGILVFK